MTEKDSLGMEQREALSDDAFISLLNMLMEADPWPYSVNRDPIEDLLDDEARQRGYCDWIEALHKFVPGPNPQPSQPVADAVDVAGRVERLRKQTVAEMETTVRHWREECGKIDGKRRAAETHRDNLKNEVARLSEQLASLTKERDEVIERSRERLVDNQRLRKLIASTHKNAVKHENCEKEFCPICEGGLFMCADCGAAEIEAEERICPAAESRLAELEQEAVKVVEFYADKESYRNRPIDEQRELLKGADPTIRISGIGEAPCGTALSDIQMDCHGNRARASLDKLRRPSGGNPEDAS